VGNEMRRDAFGLNDNETFGVVFDTFHDRRNGFLFQLSVAGAMLDAYITDERDMNRDWDTVWQARTARFEHGWTVEMAIPFKSLRFRAGERQTWGVNYKRIVRWKNEWQSLTRLPAALGRRAINRLSLAATLVGIGVPDTGRNLEVKPYGITGVTAARSSRATSLTSDPRADAGLDVKVGSPTASRRMSPTERISRKSRTTSRS
jgi:hypothetical protein